MISPGRYKAKAVEADLGVAGTGAEQVAVLFEIVDGDHAGEQITWYGYFTEATIGRTMESLRHCGWSDDDLSKLTGVLDNEVQLVVEDEERTINGETKMMPRVQWVNRGGAGLALKTRMDEGAKRAFAAKLKGAAIASRKTNGAAPANGRKASSRDLPPEAFDDSDLPDF